MFMASDFQWVIKELNVAMEIFHPFVTIRQFNYMYVLKMKHEKHAKKVYLKLCIWLQ